MPVEPKARGGPWRCMWLGCPDVNYVHSNMVAHESTPHVACTCGRAFTKQGLACHIGQVRRKRLPHPPFVSKRHCMAQSFVQLKKCT